MYDRISLLQWLNGYQQDIINTSTLENMLKSIREDQQEICNLIEFSSYINFYHTNGSLDHTHIFHLKSIDPDIIKEIRFADEVIISYIDVLNLDRLGDEPQFISANELIKLMTILIDNGYSEISIIDENRFKIKKS